MTIVDDRPAATAPPTPLHVDASRSALGSWRFASRLARREVRRRPGRTALVAVLVAVPILAMTVADLIVRTQQDAWSETFRRRAGAADIYVQYGFGDAGGELDEAPDALAELPAGTRVVDYVAAATDVQRVDGSNLTGVWFSDLAVADPITDGMVDLLDGAWPIADDEVLLSPGLADRLGVGVGDELTMARPAGTWTVTALGRLTDGSGTDVMIAPGFDRRDLARGLVVALVDLPAPIERTGIGAARDAMTPAVSEHRLAPSYVGPESSAAATMAWGWVAGAIALAAVGVVIAAAFATSARRQLVTIGQLSANGASQPLVRRVLGLQGAWCGLVGTLAGIVLGITSASANRGLVERLVGRSIGPWRVAPADLAVIAVTGVVAATVAALVPARSAARTPVLAALAGRRPLGSVPQRLVPVGLALFLGGVGLLFLVAVSVRTGTGGNVFAAAAVLGSLAVLAGMCCASPLAVDGIGRVGAHLRGTWRLAARSTARVRARSAGVLTAVATTGAIAVAGTTAAGDLGRDDADRRPSFAPADTVIVESWTSADPVIPTPEQEQAGETWDWPLPTPAALDASLVADLERILPGATWSPRRAAVYDPAPFVPGAYASVTWAIEDMFFPPGAFTVADDAVLDMVGLSSSDRRRLDDVGLINLWSVAGGGVSDEGGVDVYRMHPQGRPPIDIEVAVRRDRAVSHGGVNGVLITERRAIELGLAIVDAGVAIRSPHPLTRAQRDALADVRNAHGGSGSGSAFTDTASGRDSAASAPAASPVADVRFDDPAWEPSPALVQSVIAGVALLLTLLVVAIGLALSENESRDERDVLVAVGAKPATLSRLAGAKALVIAAAAAVLAIPTGLIPMAVVVRASSSPGTTNEVHVPWVTAVLLLTAVPAIAGLVAWGASALARRARPVRISTFAAD
jgi:putative ABC transport system permease protein